MQVWKGVVLALISAQAHAESTTPCNDCDAHDAIKVEAGYTAEIWHQARGGLATGTRYLDNAGFSVDADGDALFGLAGTTFYGSALFNNGTALNDDLTGSAQGVSNIETTRASRLFELWAQWQDSSGNRSLRFGLYDLNSEFDHIDAAELFINPSHGIGADLSQTGTNGPSIFPVTSLGIRALNTRGPWTVQAVVLDAVPGQLTDSRYPGITVSSREGALMVGELNHRAQSGARWGVGYWQYTASFRELSASDDAQAPSRNDNAGAYVMLQSHVLGADAHEGGVQVYTRAGFAESHINEIARYIGAGIVCNAVPGLPIEHRIGLAVAVAELGDTARRLRTADAAAVAGREYNYELTAQFPLSTQVSFQADLQYIEHPGMDAALQAAWLFGLRLEVGQRWSR
jgi:porin